MKRSQLFILSNTFLWLSVSSFATGQKESDVLYLNLTWHQHQPLYYKEADTEIYSRPWVRVHATKDYYDMAAILEKYPRVRATFNLTPVLIKQLDDFIAGAKDKYWVIAETPAERLNAAEKEFILSRFFDANYDNIIARFPRYQALLRKRQSLGDPALEETREAFSTGEYRDLQVLFNLAWFDPDFLSVQPLAPLVQKGEKFSEEDKTIVFDEVSRVIKEVIPVHRRLQKKGRIEVITTPYAHPILPLIFNTRIAQKSDPAGERPEWFSYPQDAAAHLSKSVDIYKDKFGQRPRGLWPAEGAVAQKIVKLVADAGYKWMASGEHVLARSLRQDGFTRNSRDTVIEADALYRPYYVRHKNGPQVAVVFRDLRLSDLLGFEYSGTPGETAARDFMDRLENIRLRLIAQAKKDPDAKGPHLVSVILDGENAWEHCPKDGKDFLHALYRMLSESKTVKTITVSEYLRKFPKQREIDDLWPGAWFSPDYGTWIGEAEETRAWNVLGKVRSHLAKYDMYGKKVTSPDKLARALDAMYLAEGSDWFWWFGADQDSGVDEYFDTAFRQLLTSVYTALGDPVPDFLLVPIIPEKPEPAERSFSGLFTPSIDGRSSLEEWIKSGYYKAPGGTQEKAFDIFERFSYGFDEDNLYLKIDSRESWAQLLIRGELHIYLQVPGQGNDISFVQHETEKQLIGFAAGYYLQIGENEAILFKVGKWGQLEKAGIVSKLKTDGSVLEAALPLEMLPEMETGDKLRLRTFFAEPGSILDRLPRSGPAALMIPETGTAEILLVVKDPEGDDYGPGTYTYPTDGVFSNGVFDVTEFSVSRDKKYIIFSFVLSGSLTNPWGSGIDLSLQTLDIYIDIDPGKGTGRRHLLEGRNASLQKGFGWEYAIWVEGWHQKIIVPKTPDDSASRPVELSATQVKVLVDVGNRKVVIRLPLAVFNEKQSHENFGYTAVLLSQEGFPSPGVRRVRDVEATASQWRLGGAPVDTNHTRILDFIWPDGAKRCQASFLNDYRPTNETSLDSLSPDDFAVLPMLIPIDRK